MSKLRPARLQHEPLRAGLDEFSSSNAGVAVADAVRMSMSIPFFFEAIKRADGDVYCDGGVLDNFPIETYDTSKTVPDAQTGRTLLVRTPNPATLGFHLGTLDQTALRINHVTRFASAVFEAILNIQNILLKATPGDELRTVFIDTLGIGTTDFHITNAQKVALIEQGRIATAKYLHNPPKGKLPKSCACTHRDKQGVRRALTIKKVATVKSRGDKKSRGGRVVPPPRLFPSVEVRSVAEPADGLPERSTQTLLPACRGRARGVPSRGRSRTACSRRRATRR